MAEIKPREEDKTIGKEVGPMSPDDPLNVGEMPDFLKNIPDHGQEEQPVEDLSKRVIIDEATKAELKRQEELKKSEENINKLFE